MVKKIVLAFSLMMAGATWCSAQTATAPHSTNQQQSGTIEKRDTVQLVAVDKIKDKNTRKQVKAQLGTMRFQKAARAMREGYFVLMASSVRHSPSGAIDASADEQANFVLVQGHSGVFQTAGRGINPGLNNMGGFTLHELHPGGQRRELRRVYHTLPWQRRCRSHSHPGHGARQLHTAWQAAPLQAAQARHSPLTCPAHPNQAHGAK